MRPKRLLFLLPLLLLCPLAQAQTMVTITPLSSGSYTFSAGSETHLVNVLPLSGGAYSFYSDAGLTTVMKLAPGVYSVTSPAGTSETLFVQDLGNGTYSFTGPNPAAVITDTTPRQIPLPALAIQPPTTNNANLFLVAVQLCLARGDVIYKGRCMSPQAADAASALKQLKKNAAQATKELRERQKLIDQCTKAGGTSNEEYPADLNCVKDGHRIAFLRQ